MKQSTFSAVMANSIKHLLQGYTKGIRFVAVLTMLLTLGIGQAWAGNHTGGYAIFDNSTTQWTTISMFIGHNSYSRGDYKFTNITNTQLYYLQFTNNNKFEGWTEWMLWNNSWAGENNSISHRKAYFPDGSKYSGTNTSYEITNGVCFISAPTSTTNGWALNPSYYSSYTELNTDQKATVQSTTDGSTYNAGSVSISTYKLSSATAVVSSTGTTSASAARTAQVKMTATAKTGYTFVGWYNSSGTRQTTNVTYTYTCSGSTATYYARFKAIQSTVTLNKQSGTGGTSSVTATYGQAMPSATMPTRTGYTFNGYFDATSGGTKYYDEYGTSAKNWDKTSATTLYAQWTIKSYSVKWVVDGVELTGAQLGGANTIVNHGDKIETAPKVEVEDYCGDKFVGWTTSFYVDPTDAPATLYSTAADIPAIEGDITFYAVFADYE